VALILTRQGLPILDRSNLGAAIELRNGAYVLGRERGELEGILIASGSEVHPALEAWKRLSQEGLGVRLVSMPSWELFEAEDQSYRDSLLPSETKARLAIEAGSPTGWERYVGSEGDVIGIKGFGASAPGNIALERYGFTVENIMASLKSLIS
jgi:transketolase